MLPYDVSKFPYKNYEDNGPFIQEAGLPERKIIFTNPKGEPDSVHDRSFDFSWTPDVKRLIFPYDNHLDVLTLGVDPSNLIDFPYISISRVSHDGQKVVGRGGGGGVLAISDINTQKVERIILPKQLQPSGVPGWLPDDRQIVFYDNGGDTYVINPDGSNLQKVLINNKSCATLAPTFQNW